MENAAVERISYGAGYGYGDGFGSGSSYGYGDGDGSGDGSGSGSDSGYGSGFGYGSGSGDGSGSGSSYGYGDGDGSGFGSDSGYSYGYGAGYGYGDGFGFGYWSSVSNLLSASWVLGLPNAEMRRKVIQIMGPDRFFSQLNGAVSHADIDGVGNRRELIKFKMEDTATGFLLAVKVICPTTRRKYYLGVPPTVKTCQEAVAATFKMKPSEYSPERES